MLGPIAPTGQLTLAASAHRPEIRLFDTADRRYITQDDFGLGYCNTTKYRTELS